MISLFIETSDEGKALITKFETEFKKLLELKEINFEGNEGLEIKVGELVFKIKIVK